MYKYVNDYCKSCNACQITRGLAIQSLAKLVMSLPKEPFMKWGFDIMGPIKPTSRYTKKKIHFYNHRLCYQVSG
jgi:hypothetical protein